MSRSIVTLVFGRVAAGMLTLSGSQGCATRSVGRKKKQNSLSASRVRGSSDVDGSIRRLSPTPRGETRGRRTGQVWREGAHAPAGKNAWAGGSLQAFGCLQGTRGRCARPPHEAMVSVQNAALRSV